MRDERHLDRSPNAPGDVNMYLRMLTAVALTAVVSACIVALFGLTGRTVTVAATVIAVLGVVTTIGLLLRRYLRR